MTDVEGLRIGIEGKLRLDPDGRYRFCFIQDKILYETACADNLIAHVFNNGEEEFQVPFHRATALVRIQKHKVFGLVRKDGCSAELWALRFESIDASMPIK